MSPPVIVGFDGSASARAAVRYGADEAMLRDCGLHLLHAFSWPLIYPPFDTEYDPQDHGPRVAMRNLLALTARDVQRDHPDLTVAERLIDGSPGGVLVDASRDSQLLVVGHRGMGGFTGLLAGSVGIQAAGHAHCPVVVVRGDPVSADAPIVVGVDGSSGARAGLDAAFAQAHRRGVELLVICHQPPDARRPAVATASAGASSRPSVVDKLAMIPHGAAARHSDVKYRVEFVDGDTPATALIAVARRVEAGLLVVGTRGVGGFRGLVMGSTSRSLIEHASCPVMVVPPGVHRA